MVCEQPGNRVGHYADDHVVNHVCHHDSEFHFLTDAAQRLSDCPNANRALQVLVMLIQDHWQPEAVSIARVEADRSLVFCAASGETSDRIVGLRLPPGCGIAGWVAEQGRRLWVPDVYGDARFYAQIDRKTGFSTRALLAVPMKVGGDVLAVLEFINPQPDTDMRAVDDTVAALALLAAPAIANVKLTQRVDEAEARYRRLFELNLDPIVVLDDQGRLLEANQMAQTALGLRPDEEGHIDLARLGCGDGGYAALCERTQSQGAVTWEYQLPEVEQYFEARLSHLPDCLPGGGKYLWIGHDVTDRVELELSRQRFMHMIVHDLRAPLSSVLNSLELVLTAWREKDLTMPIEQVLGIGLRSANRMGRLISDILDSAALQANERALEITEIDVPSLVNEAVETVSPSLHRHRHSLEADLSPDLPVIMGDADLLRRVLINLLTNAVKFTPDGGEIRVQVKANGDQVRFSVSDNGVGIAPALQDSIFKLYVRGMNRKAKGTGIGLAFCKLAVEAHGGRIWFESELEEGTTFTFTIPPSLPAHLHP